MQKEGLKPFLEVSAPLRARKGQTPLPDVPPGAWGWGQGDQPVPALLPLPARLLLHSVHGALEGRLQGLQLVHGFPQQEPGQELLHLRGGLVPLGQRGEDLSDTSGSVQGHAWKGAVPEVNQMEWISIRLLVITKSDTLGQK